MKTKNLKEESKKQLERKARVNKITKKKAVESAEQKERRERVYRVTLLLADVPYQSQSDREEAILSYCKSKLNFEEMNKLIDPLRVENIKTLRNNRNNQITKMGVF